jgi:hypothetical protein
MPEEDSDAWNALNEDVGIVQHKIKVIEVMREKELGWEMARLY